ncbi:zinc-binding protein A33-like isoform X1 [Latimeria chalumnae]|uniref:zinc-binding protein A33-like isoform X1 n=1 Tax=Latimeria chalumnae TaxID=7897 RepID=UPI00313EB5AA
MRRQLSCSFCKELYREPILLQCDHNLCRTCLPKVQVGTSDIVRCPECHQDCNNTALRRNPLLENIVERYREAEGNQQLYCEEHGVRLELFCKEEQKAICLVCGTSQRHRDHQHEAIAVAADGYKRELENSLRALQEEENEARKCLEEEKQEIRKLKEKKNYLKKKVGEELGRLQDFLEDERKKINRELDATEERYIKILEENKRRISHQIPELQNAIAEITNTLERAEPELLRDIGTTLERAEVQFINPERPSVDLCEEQFIGPLQYKVWKRMKDSIIPVLKSITIDQDTAHKQLLISRDRSGIKYGLTEQDRPDREERFENSFAALGSERFTSGRHYWEVEVGDKAFWKLGVAKESIERKEPLTNTPQDGLWVLGLGNRNNYMVFTPEAETFPLEVRPRKVGVYLDYEGGKVSFYNADNVSHIYTYTDTFTERMYPYFSPYSSDVDNEDDLPLRIVPL